MSTSAAGDSEALIVVPLHGEPERASSRAGAGRGAHKGGQSRRKTAGDVLAARIRDQVRTVLAEEARFREDVPEAEHQVRVAVRRLRSALRTFEPLFEKEVATDLEAELHWLAGAFGSVRDHLVLRDRLFRQLDVLSPGQIIGPVRARIDQHLGAEVATARAAALAELDGSRHRQLVERMAELSGHPPFLPAADAPAREVLLPLLADELRRLRHHVRTAFASPMGETRDLAFHHARRTAKRVRYGAETLTLLSRAEAKSFVRALTEVQDILGDRQDAVVAGALLWDLGVRVGAVAGESGYTFGLLAGLEAAQARADEQLFAEAWARFDRKRNRRWLG